MHNLIKVLYLNTVLKKQKYFLDYKNVFENYSIKDLNENKFLTKSEIQMMKSFKKYNHSYFDLSSVPRYKLSTMKKVVEKKVASDNFCYFFSFKNSFSILVSALFSILET